MSSERDTATASWVVVVGGDQVHPDVVHRLPRRPFVVCADSGLDHAYALGLAPDLVVGDLDSVQPDSLDRAQREGVTVEAYPTDKDATDTELALAAAVRSGAAAVTLVGGGSTDRLDHSLGAIMALAHPSLAALDHVEAWWARTHLSVVHGPRQVSLDLLEAATVSLLPLGGPCEGVTTQGLRWGLTDETLLPNSSRGLSNEVVASPARVHVRSGALAVVVPEAL
jgi:thiamine pyrophosphokinase